MKRFCLVDYESASAADLKKCGAWCYWEHPTTEILCLGHTDGETFTVLTPADLMTPGGPLLEAALDPECMFIAHNVLFEKRGWVEGMQPLGWPPIPDDRWHDILASCAMRALPLKLERAASVLRLSQQKDTEGTKATVALSRTNKKGYHDRSDEKLQRVYDYNAQDLRAELALHRRVRGLGNNERRVWLLDQQINARGVRLDMDFVSAAQAVCEQAARPLARRFSDLTGIKPTQRDKFMFWLQCNGADLPDLKKETLDKILGDDDGQEAEDTLAETGDEETEAHYALPDICREALGIRRILGSASIKKLASMPLCCASDGRAHGLLQYHGAGPGRWAGRLLQPHNFPRPSLKISKGFGVEGKEIFEGHDPDQLVAAILTRDAEYVRAFFGEPIEAVASGLRHTLIAGPGSLFEVGDFSAVEARIVLALAGAHSALAIMKDDTRNVYCEMGAKIFPLEAPRGKAAIKAWKEAHLFEYTISKSTVLGAGFQMGARKFKARYAQGHPDEFAEKCIAAYREDFAPEVPKLWEELGKAAIRTVWDRTAHEAYGVLYQLEDGFLTARLPSGRKLWYYDPKAEMLPMPWDPDDKRQGFTYTAQKTGRIIRVKGYGGLLTENVVQALARDLLVHGMFNAEQDGHNVVLTVHDEIICEVPEWQADAKLLEQFMTSMPQWAKELGVPVNAECWTGDRYRK